LQSEPTQRQPVLFVDDEEDMIDTFLNNFEDEFEVLTATNGQQALEILKSRDAAVMVTDQRMPGMYGLEVIRRGLEIRPDLVPIILTGFTNDRDLIEAINLQRIHRYIAKPWDPEELRHSIEGALERHQLVLENRRLTKELREANQRLRVENAFLKASDAPRTLVGSTPMMRRLLEEIGRIASKNVTALIEGETGTGKELVARAIHGGSPRRDRLFVAVNCAELSSDAAESRLFGHRKGSFTGAIDDHKGFFEVADRGTLFLDEVGELALPVQAKLLRVLQEGELLRFGDSKPRKVDVRLIAATNRRLDAEVEAGRFRQDLLYRLKVLPIRVPPLRERREDIPPLIEHFVALHAHKLGVPVPEITPEALRALVACDFPGNVRDLENTIIRAMVLAEPGDTIALADLAGIPAPPEGPDAPPESREDLEASGLHAAVAHYERRQIEQALEAAGGNRARAARALGISRRWLLKKLERYGMETAGDARE
jgi:DNA-binding NtrC family response regulator